MILYRKEYRKFAGGGEGLPKESKIPESAVAAEQYASADEYLRNNPSTRLATPVSTGSMRETVDQKWAAKDLNQTGYDLLRLGSRGASAATFGALDILPKRNINPNGERSKILDIVDNPMTSLQSVVNRGYVPDHLAGAVKAGHVERNAYDSAIDWFNAPKMAKAASTVPGHLDKGDYFSAGVAAAGSVPQLKGVKKVLMSPAVKPFEAGLVKLLGSNVGKRLLTAKLGNVNLSTVYRKFVGGSYKKYANDAVDYVAATPERVMRNLKQVTSPEYQTNHYEKNTKKRTEKL